MRRGDRHRLRGQAPFKGTGTVFLRENGACPLKRCLSPQFLAAGALFAAASLVTLRRYHPIGPWWLSLVLGGAACLALAVALRRRLDAGPGRERWGFTAEPLFEDRRVVRAAQAAATVVAMSPGPRVVSEAPFEGGGGRSEGGGATGGA